MKKPKTLRARMAGATFLSLLLLWAVVMLILHSATADRIQMEVSNRRADIERLLQLNCQIILTGDRDENDKRMMQEYYLSNDASSLNGYEGGLTMRMYDVEGNETARTQLAHGMADAPLGTLTATGRRGYHLSMDEALDDEGVLAYLDWIINHRRKDSGYALPNDGTVGIITGVVEHSRIRVSRIVVRNPDDSESIVMEAEEGRFDGEELTTLEVPGMELESPLLPGLSWDDDGQYSDKVDLKARLAHYRVTERKLDEFYAVNGAPTNMGGDFGNVSYDGQEDGTSLAMGYDYNRDYLAHKELLFTYVSTLLVALALGWFLSKYLSCKLSRPLEQLTHDAAQGRPSASGGPIVEVNALATAFNTAQQKMADDLKREQDLTRAVAHELKTPLAILRSHAEALSEDIDPAKRSAYLNIIMDESDRMAALVGELLDLSRMEAGAEVLNREEVDLKALTERVFAPLQNLARVSLDLAPLTVSGDPKLLERAISNYASNALRHCAEGGEIRVTLRAEGRGAVLTVENDGDPIPPEALPHLWDTFYKADTARTRGSGTGLGLAIVKSIAALHGGDCGAENLPGSVAFHLFLSCNEPSNVV